MIIYSSMDRRELNQEEILQKVVEATTLLAFHPYFNVLKFKVSSVNQFLEEVVESDREMDALTFFKEGIKRSLTPLLYQLMLEKIASFIEKHSEEKDFIQAAGWLLQFIQQGFQPWEIPFFYVIFTRQVLEHPLSTNRKIWECIKDFVPRRIEEPEESGVVVPGEEKKEEDLPPGFKRDEKTGILLPEDEKPSEGKRIILTDG